MTKKRAKRRKKSGGRSASSGRGSRMKGQRGENSSKKILAALWSDFDRNFQDRGGDRDGPDLHSAKARLDGEVKHRDKTMIQAAIRDAIANCREGRTWFAIDWPTAGPRKKPVIVFDLDQFVELIKRERIIANQRGFEQGLAERDEV